MAAAAPGPAGACSRGRAAQRPWLGGLRAGCSRGSSRRHMAQITPAARPDPPRDRPGPGTGPRGPLGPGPGPGPGRLRAREEPPGLGAARRRPLGGQEGDRRLSEGGSALG